MSGTIGRDAVTGVNGPIDLGLDAATVTTAEAAELLCVAPQELNRRPHVIPPLRVGEPGRKNRPGLWSRDLILKLAALMQIGMTMREAMKIADFTEVTSDRIVIRRRRAA